MAVTIATSFVRGSGRSDACRLTLTAVLARSVPASFHLGDNGRLTVCVPSRIAFRRCVVGVPQSRQCVRFVGVDVPWFAGFRWITVDGEAGLHQQAQAQHETGADGAACYRACHINGCERGGWGRLSMSCCRYSANQLDFLRRWGGSAARTTTSSVGDS